MLAIFPEISAAVKGGDLERVGVLVRTYFCGESATQPKFAAETMLKRYGINVVRMPLQDFGRIAVRDERGSVQCSIAVREGLSTTQEAFLLAHMLGHFILHVQPRIARAEWNTSGFREEYLPSDRYTHAIAPKDLSAAQYTLEDQADRFAGSVLMPAAMIKRAKEKLGSLDAVAKVFGVSREMVERRLDDLNGEGLVGQVVQGAIAGASRNGGKNQTAPQQSPQLHTHRGSVEDTAHMVRESHHKDAPMPRAVAAQSYSATSSPPVTAKPTDDPQPSLLSGKGMERLREIARQLDKSGR